MLYKQLFAFAVKYTLIWPPPKPKGKPFQKYLQKDRCKISDSESTASCRSMFPWGQLYSHWHGLIHLDFSFSFFFCCMWTFFGVKECLQLRCGHSDVCFRWPTLWADLSFSNQEHTEYWVHLHARLLVNDQLTLRNLRNLDYWKWNWSQISIIDKTVATTSAGNFFLERCHEGHCQVTESFV